MKDFIAPPCSIPYEGFHMVCYMTSSNKIKQRLHLNQHLTFDLQKKCCLIFFVFSVISRHLANRCSSFSLGLY